MQTQPEAQVGNISGARQTVLVSPDQIRPGVFMTGLAASYLHEVISVEAGVVTTQIHPKPQVPPEHLHAFTQVGNTGCACGLRRHPVAVWMSENRETPRTHIIVPMRSYVSPNPYTIYGIRQADGSVQMIRGEHGARAFTPSAGENHHYPLFLRAVKLWELPEQARRLMEGELIRNQVVPDGPIDE